MGDSPRIGILVKTYPKLSETFILGEILGLQREEVLLHVFALQRSADVAQHAATAQIEAPVIYIPRGSPGQRLRLLKVHAAQFLCAPKRYLQTLVFALRRRESGGLLDFLRAGGLAAALRRHRIRHLHAHFISEPAALAELAARLSGVPFSISAHAKDIYLSESGVLRRKLANASFTVTCTEYNRRHLASLAPPDATILRLYHGIDSGRFQPNPRPEHPPLILSVGRLREKKGFPTLILACAQLLAAGVELRCEIVGYGPDRDRLQALIETAGGARAVKLIDAMPHEALIERYRRAALFVLPCQIGADGDRDGIPNVLVEAMAMALPVISTRISGIPELITDGVNGLLVAERDAPALAQAIAGVLNQSGRAAALGQAARATVVQRFDARVTARGLRDLLLRSAHQPAVGVQATP